MALRTAVRQRQAWTAALVLFAVLAAARSADAQVIRSYESLDRSAGEDGYATVVLLFDGSVGNTEFVDTDLSAALGYRGDRHWVRVYPAYRIKESGDTRLVDARSLHVRHSLSLTSRTSTFAFVQLQSEKSVALDRRLLAGGGLRTQLLALGDGGVDAGIGAMFEEERRAGDTRSLVRGAHFISAHGTAGVADLSATIYVQPAMSAWDDHRVMAQMTATVPLVSHVSLDLSGSWRRDSRPPAGIEPDDARIRIGLRLDLD